MVTDEVAGEVLLVGELRDVRLGPAQGADLLVGERLAVELVEAVAHGVVEHLAAADALVDQGAAPCPAEAGDVDLGPMCS